MIIGDILATNKDGDCKILSLTRTHASIQFLNTGSIRDVRRNDLRLGEVKDRYAPSVYGVGFIGDGEFNSKNSPLSYDIWKSILRRCYSEKDRELFPTYVGCTVDSRWHNFQQFQNDYRNMPNYGKSNYHLDKDWILIGNKTYGPEYCSLIPAEINAFKPTLEVEGISKHRAKFRVYVHGVYIDSFQNETDAKYCYFTMKRFALRYYAKEFKSVLHPKVYKNLRAWRPLNIH